MELLENSMLDSQLLEPGAEVSSKPLGTNFETKIFKFWCFLGPFDHPLTLQSIFLPLIKI